MFLTETQQGAGALRYQRLPDLPADFRAAPDLLRAPAEGQVPGAGEVGSAAKKGDF